MMATALALTFAHAIAPRPTPMQGLPSLPSELFLGGVTSAVVDIRTAMLPEVPRFRALVERAMRDVGLKVDEHIKSPNEAVLKLELLTELEADAIGLVALLSVYRPVQGRGDEAYYVQVWQVAVPSAVMPNESLLAEATRLAERVLTKFREEYDKEKGREAFRLRLLERAPQ